MTPLEIRIACLWRRRFNTNEIAKKLKMKECDVDRMRPAHLAKKLWVTECVEWARV